MVVVVGRCVEEVVVVLVVVVEEDMILSLFEVGGSSPTITLC